MGQCDFFNTKTMSTNSIFTYFFFFVLFFSASCENDNTTEGLSASFDIISLEKGDNYRLFVNTTSGNIDQYVWNFGEGTSVINQDSIEIFYDTAGEYSVTLDVLSGQELSRDTQTVVIAQDGLKVGFEVSQDANNPYLYTFVNASVTNAQDLEWSLDYLGAITDAEEVTLYCGYKGNYSVKLEATVDGVLYSSTQTFTVATEDPTYWTSADLIFEDNFDGTGIDDSKWRHETGGGGWGNSELQYYTSGNNTSVEDGKLKITAKKESYSGNSYTSSRINGTDYFLYGKFEFSVKMPDYNGGGIWPAGWMLGKAIKQGVSWPLCGEIDIMEYTSTNPNYYLQTIHTQSNNHSSGTQIGTGNLLLNDIEEEFHTYGLLWTPKYLKFYLDSPDNVTLTIDRFSNATDSNWPFDKPFYFLFNVAVGGMFGGTVNDAALPAVYAIDYVRVYQNTQYH